MDIPWKNGGFFMVVEDDFIWFNGIIVDNLYIYVYIYYIYICTMYCNQILMDLPSGNQPGGWEIWEIPKVNGYLSGKIWRNYTKHR